jgi:hypothetical protein
MDTIMKHILTLLAFAWASTSLFAQNSTLTLYITSTIPGSTELTVSAMPMGTSDITIVDVVMVTDTDETVVVYALPDSIGGASVFLSYACDSVPIEVPAGFVFGPNTPGGDPVESEIAGELDCSTLSISEERAPDWIVFPNPASHRVTVASSTALPADLTLRNALGRTVRTVKTEGTSEFTLDLQGLSPGVYFVEIASQGALHHQRLLVD